MNMESSSTNKPASVGLLRHIRFEHLYAGVSGGVVSTLVLHPLELVKIRFQVNEGNGSAGRPTYQGTLHAMRSIFHNSGFVGLYQGVTPNIWGAGISWGLYFFFYNTMKTWMQEGNSQVNLGAANHLLIASTAGFSTLVLTNPIWVTRTRLCLQYEGVAGAGASAGAGAGAGGIAPVYHGTINTLVQIFKGEGIRGLYKGFVPGVLGISHGALQFMAYEEMKTMFNQYRNQPLDTQLTSAEYVLIAAASKMHAACLTYPFQVVRSRLQDQHRAYKGVIDVCQQIIRKESYRGFYKGFCAYMLHVTPNICIVFLLYELLTRKTHEPSIAIKTEIAELTDAV
ncbi:solute carrier family 25 member 32-like [Babylonia areolata]|uniref:solute carrier family 25 member 32-like n=1 Tax=Babylonia areolata TaxID=304850 RepID=UPI003FD06D80